MIHDFREEGDLMLGQDALEELIVDYAVEVAKLKSTLEDVKIRVAEIQYEYDFARDRLIKYGAEYNVRFGGILEDESPLTKGFK